MTMNPVVHFEMPAEDRERMKSFYAKAFGWQFNQLGPEMGNYTMVMTSDRSDMTQFPDKPGTIDGGFFDKTKNNQHPSVVISVDDIEEAARKVREAGGKVLGGHKGDGSPDPIPGVGLYSAIIDTEGNRISIIQAEPKQGE